MGFLQQFVATAPAANRGMLEGISAGEEFRKAGMRLDAMRQQEAINRGLLAEEAGAAPRLNIGQGMDVVDVPTPQQQQAAGVTVPGAVTVKPFSAQNQVQQQEAAPKLAPAQDRLEIMRQLDAARKNLDDLKGPWYLPTPTAGKAQIPAAEAEVARLEQLYKSQVVPAAQAEYQKVNPQYRSQAQIDAQAQARAAEAAKAQAKQQGIEDWKLDQKGKPIIGLMNNNPGNIRVSKDQWVGASGANKGFVTFDTPENGVRAMALNLLSYQEQGLTTPRQIISKWAPPNENTTGEYINFVAKQLGVKPDDKLNLADANTMQALMAAMITKENGKMPYSGDVLNSGISMAFNAKQLPVGQMAGMPGAPAAQTQTTGVSTAPAAGAAQPTTAQQQAGLKAANAPDFVKPAKWYAANPDAINRDMQIAMDDRERLVRLANVYRNAGAGEQYFKMVEQIKAQDNNLYALQGVQGLAEFTPQYGYDSRRLAAVWSAASGGQPHAIQPRSDGKFNLYVNGQLTQEGLSYGDVSTMARNAIDATFRKEQAAAKAAAAGKRFDSTLKIEEERSKQYWDMVKQTVVERVKGDAQMGIEYLKKTAGWDVKATGNPDVVMITPPGGGAPMVMNTAGKTINFDGQEITAYNATPVSGLPLMTQQRLMN